MPHNGCEPPKFRIESRNRATFFEWSKCDDMYSISSSKSRRALFLVLRLFSGSVTTHSSRVKQHETTLREKEKRNNPVAYTWETQKLIICIYLYDILIYIYIYYSWMIYSYVNNQYWEKWKSEFQSTWANGDKNIQRPSGNLSIIPTADDVHIGQTK